MNHFKKMSILGYGYTQQEFVDVASQYAVQLGKRTADKPLSMKWIKGFLSRWPEMKVTKLMKGKALRKQSLHAKTADSVLLKLFISGNE